MLGAENPAYRVTASGGGLRAAPPAQHFSTSFDRSGLTLSSGAAHGPAISAGNLYVSELSNQRVQEFSTAGTFLGSFDPAGSGTGKSNGPWSIAADPTSGNLYVSELGNDRVQEFNDAGAFITAFASVGSGSRQLQSPTGIAVGPSGKIFIADTGNNRVEEWAP